MLLDFLKDHVGQNAAPFAAIALFVIVVGAALWLTPRLSKWIDARKDQSIGFFDGMLEKPPEQDNDE